MKQSSRNFQPSSSYRKFLAIFASPNTYFRESSRRVPLNKCKLAVPKPRRCGTAWLWRCGVFLQENLKKINLEMCNILTRPPCKACLLFLLFYYLNEILCINNVTLPLLMCINGLRQQTSSGYQECALKQCIQR